MLKKPKKRSNEKKETSSDIFNEIDDSSYNCYCNECSGHNLDNLHDKINFSLDNICDFSCNFYNAPPVEKRKSKKKKKSKKKSEDGSIISVTSEIYPLPSSKRSQSILDNKDMYYDSLHQLKYSTKSLSTNDLPGFKGMTKQLKKLKGVKKTGKLCSTIGKLDAIGSSSFQNLCQRFKSTSLNNLLPITTSDTVKSIVHLSDHDKKILDRMSMKNLKEIALVENAMLARKYWESEKSEREKLRNKQHEHYLRLIQQRRQQEQLEFSRRKQTIEDKEKVQCEKIQGAIAAKNVRAKNILKNIEIEREIGECKRRNREYQRMEAILTNYEESRLDNEIYRETLNERLEERINKADNIRTKNLDVYKVRLQTDNQIHHQIHAANYDQTKRIEYHKNEKLREKINERDSKFKKFADHKRKAVEESQNQAKTSALLRELVRQSFTNECFKISATPSQQQRFGDGRFSNMSYKSHVSHINLS